MSTQDTSRDCFFLLTYFLMGVHGKEESFGMEESCLI